MQNIPRLSGRFSKAIAFHALFQAAISKRPYNLFHRRNLYMRLAKVNRSFGNKTTWDKPFKAHFRHFVAMANSAVFNGPQCRAINGDATEASGEFDLVYIDPPYLNSRGVGVDYAGFYHFLEGMADYPNWEAKIDLSSKHRRLFHRRPRLDQRRQNPAGIFRTFPPTSKCNSCRFLPQRRHSVAG